MTYICVSKLTSIGSDNGLSPGRRETIIWTNARILLIRTLRKNFNEIVNEIHIFIQENAFESIICEMAVICFCLNMLTPKHTNAMSILSHHFCRWRIIIFPFQSITIHFFVTDQAPIICYTICILSKYRRFLFINAHITMVDGIVSILVQRKNSQHDWKESSMSIYRGTM